MAQIRIDYRELEKLADESIKSQLNESRNFIDSVSIEHASVSQVHEKILPVLHSVSDFISVSSKEILDAGNSYQAISESLQERLNSPNGSILIYPQGSAGSRTLIRSPYARERFDIDAVCEIDIPSAFESGPNHFFELVGMALGKDNKVTRKKRCWRIEFPGEKYYIDMTPAVKDSRIAISESTRIFGKDEAYKDDMVWVVNEPTNQWYASNPKGIGRWVEDRNNESSCLIRVVALESARVLARDGIDPVPEQDISYRDTLLLAVRLFKRHRDIKVRDGKIQSEYKPISIIIVTLLGQCIKAMSENGRSYDSPVGLLADLAGKLPRLVKYENGVPYVPNPTANGENFADRWLEEGGKRKRAFDDWTAALQDDLRRLSSAQDEKTIKEIIVEIFGCSEMYGISGNNAGTPLASGAPGSLLKAASSASAAAIAKPSFGNEPRIPTKPQGFA